MNLGAVAGQFILFIFLGVFVLALFAVPLVYLLRARFARVRRVSHSPDEKTRTIRAATVLERIGRFEVRTVLEEFGSPCDENCARPRKPGHRWNY